ncbi:natterin-3-like [Atheta coriaria]|uniref:natterin-3-like n=1 Tax=Dalotia coriaria TaxID=877792 RepID=UPI0031F34C56
MSDTGFYWAKSNTCNASVPFTAVQGGTDSDGSPIYVGRAFISGDWCPAKVVPSRKQAYVAHGSREHCVSNYEVLCERRFQWVRTSGGNIPHNAVCGGQTSGGEKLYIGRAYHNSSNTVGKVHPSHKCLYIPYGGQEVKYVKYEILVRS